MTARAMDGDRERCIQAGMDDYVSKPLSRQSLIDVLSRWLFRRSDEPDRTRLAESPAPAHDSVSPAVFAREALLERLMNDEELARVVVESFLNDIPRQIEKLRNCLDAQDASGAERQVHTIAGAAANVSGEALKTVASEMEAASRSGDLRSVAARLDELDNEFSKLKAAMTTQAWS